MPRIKRSHCRKGHVYDTVNTYYKKNGARDCKACKNEYYERQYAERRLKKPIAIRVYATPSIVDLSWAAGLFEGEGTITISSNGGKKRPYLTQSKVIVGNTDYQIVSFFKDRWGGNLRVRKKISGKKQAYEWTLMGSQTWIFLNDLLPYFRTNRVKEKANLLVEAEEFRRRSPKFGAGFKAACTKLSEYLAKFRELNKRGENVP